jgi:hypothetical protein
MDDHLVELETVAVVLRGKLEFWKAIEEGVVHHAANLDDDVVHLQPT